MKKNIRKAFFERVETNKEVIHFLFSYTHTDRWQTDFSFLYIEKIQFSKIL